METPALQDNRGFSLVELLVSIVILTIALLGILQSLTIYTRHNLHNLVREDAVRIAQQCLEDIKNKVDCPTVVSRRFRDFSINFYISAPLVSSLPQGSNTPVSIKVSFKYPFSGASNATYTLTSVVYIQ